MRELCHASGDTAVTGSLGHRWKLRGALAGQGTGAPERFRRGEAFKHHKMRAGPSAYAGASFFLRNALTSAPMLPSAHTPQSLPTAQDVDAAAQLLAGGALRTPLIASPVLDSLTGARVFLKAETLQRTGSFKFRGAYNKLASIPPAQRAGGVVAFSSGNHAQGVAAAAGLLGMPAVIVMPSDAPRGKRARTAALGADIVLFDRATDDREAMARDIAGKRNAVLVPPYDDPKVIAGQGTVGREIMEDLAALDL